MCRRSVVKLIIMKNYLVGRSLILAFCLGGAVACSSGGSSIDEGPALGGNTDGISGGTTGGTTGGSSGGTTGGTTGGGNPPSGGATDGVGTPGTVGVFSGLNVFHRSGQTFLTWNEANDQTGYHVYRSNQPITSANLSSAQRLTEQWGSLDALTSLHRMAGNGAPANFVINELSAPLRDDQGLFVYTTQANEAGPAYYAVTEVVNGSEVRTVNPGQTATSEPVSEQFASPAPVLVSSVNGGRGRVYTQFMDYANWNPTLKGYAFNYAVALPADYNPSIAYPLRLELHAYGERHKFVEQTEFDWPVIQLFTDDPGADAGSLHTWWYGFAAEHDYRRSGTPQGGTVVNFTEQRVMRAVEEVIRDGGINVDTNLIHAFGHSMGASGALSLGMRYGNVFAGIYASEPMTNYRTSPTFENEFVSLWGQKAPNLVIENDGPFSDIIRQYSNSGTSPTLVWDWMDHPRQLARRSGEDMAYLMVDHGKQDTVIDWQTQGRPFVRALTDGKRGFSGQSIGDAGHFWQGFGGVPTQQFGFGFSTNTGWVYERSASFPGILNASGSGAVDAGSSGDDRYNLTIEWSTPWLSFHQPILDQPGRYEISLRSTFGGNQTADITPRRTTGFKPSPGQTCSWTAVEISSGNTIGQGNEVVDSVGLFTARQVPIFAGSGSRLRISC